jgi:uncharacterized membrane protein YdjX (TVP38/TMEM64 family)
MNKSTIKKLIVALLFLIIFIGLNFMIRSEVISFEFLKAQKMILKAFIKNHYALSIFTFISFYIFAVAVSLPVAALLTIFGGFLFGAIKGLIFTNIGATLGSMISFLIFRYLIGGLVQQKYAQQLKDFNKAFEENGAYYLLSSHFIVVIPLFVVNILASLTKVSLFTFIWTTSLGIIPASTVFAFAGQHLGEIESVMDIFSYKIILIFLMLALVALLPVIVKKFSKKNAN